MCAADIWMGYIETLVSYGGIFCNSCIVSSEYILYILKVRKLALLEWNFRKVYFPIYGSHIRYFGEVQAESISSGQIFASRKKVLKNYELWREVPCF